MLRFLLEESRESFIGAMDEIGVFNRNKSPGNEIGKREGDFAIQGCGDVGKMRHSSEFSIVPDPLFILGLSKWIVSGIGALGKTALKRKRRHYGSNLSIFYFSKFLDMKSRRRR